MMYLKKHRKAFTQLRLGSHKLKIETERWARISQENRLCSCGQIQTKCHVILSCPVTESLRRQYPYLDFADLLTLMDGEPHDVAAFCSQLLRAMSISWIGVFFRNSCKFCPVCFICCHVFYMHLVFWEIWCALMFLTHVLMDTCAAFYTHFFPLCQ